MRQSLKIIEQINKTDIADTAKLLELGEELYYSVAEKIKLKRKFDPKQATEAVRNILKVISVIPDGIKQMFWIKQLGLVYEIKEDLLIKELKFLKDKEQKRREWKKKIVDRKK